MVASSETANFLNAEVKYELCARVVISTRRTLLFVFQHGLLAVPPTRYEFRECAALLLPPTHLSQQGSGSVRRVVYNEDREADFHRLNDDGGNVSALCRYVANRLKRLHVELC